MTDKIHMREMPADTKCDVHDVATDGLARHLVAKMREMHGRGGVNACRECIERAHQDAKEKAGR